MTKRKKLGLILGISIPCGYILTIGLCFAFAFLIMSTPFTYKGEYKDLYTTAVCNVFGVYGYTPATEIFISPYIEIIEKDDYGRTLFFYQETASDSQGLDPFYYGAILIMQKSDNEKAYYYDNCYLPFYKRNSSKLNYKTLFTDEQIDAFKSSNNWCGEMNENLLLSSKLVVRPPDGKLSLKDKDFELPLKAYTINSGYDIDGMIYQKSLYCQTDKNGLELYYVRGLDRNAEPEKSFDFAMIFNPDKTCPLSNIVEIENVYDTERLLSDLKSEVGWSR